MIGRISLSYHSPLSSSVGSASATTLLCHHRSDQPQLPTLLCHHRSDQPQLPLSSVMIGQISLSYHSPLS
jgi:hypothetical protein